MSAMPLVAKSALVAFLLVAIWRAHFGRPPRRADARRAAVWVVVAFGMHAAAVAGLLADGWWAGPALGAGVLCWCVAAWFVRGDEDEGGGGGGGRDPDPTRPGPIDWDAFDRARAGWSRPRLPA